MQKASHTQITFLLIVLVNLGRKQNKKTLIKVSDVSVYLRCLEPDDLERTYKWHNDPKLYESLGGVFRYVSRASEEEWLRKASSYSANEVSLAICLTNGGRHIGNVYLRNIDWVSRRAELHIFIGEPNERSNGYGTAAVNQVLQHAFQDLGLHRVYLFVLEDNKPAIRTYEKCGFAVEGRLRQHAFKGGAFKDVVVMGICSNDWALRKG